MISRLAVKASRALLGAFDHLIRGCERRAMSRQADTGIQPVFIVGAPRTGSTLLYQLLTNRYDVMYIDNLIDQFYRNLYFGFWLSRRLFGSRPHNCFTSRFGVTTMGGLHAPSECGKFWYRWLPLDRHYIKKGDVTPAAVEEMRAVIFSVINRYRKPLLFKNMNAGQRLALIAGMAPSAKIIFVRRNPLYTAQSILKTRLAVGNSKRFWWSIMPENYHELTGLDYPAQIVRQIFHIEQTIHRDMSLFPADQCRTVWYEDLCGDPGSVAGSLGGFIDPALPERPGAETAAPTCSCRQTVDDTDFAAFKKEIAVLDWTRTGWEEGPG